MRSTMKNKLKSLTLMTLLVLLVSVRNFDPFGNGGIRVR